MPQLKPKDFDVTKNSDYFVWKDTSERVARHCDDIVDKKRVNSCVLKHPLLGGSWATKNIAKISGNALSHALLMSRFQNFFDNRASHGFN